MQLTGKCQRTVSRELPTHGIRVEANVRSLKVKLSRWAFVAAALATPLTLSTPLAAHAEDPVDLSGAYIIDTARAITPEEGSEVLLALDELYTRADIQLFVVYVGTFSNPSNPIAWADTVAIDNGLGADDVL